jgi:hypothetical protein
MSSFGEDASSLSTEKALSVISLYDGFPSKFRRLCWERWSKPLLFPSLFSFDDIELSLDTGETGNPRTEKSNSPTWIPASSSALTVFRQRVLRCGSRGVIDMTTLGLGMTKSIFVG